MGVRDYTNSPTTVGGIGIQGSNLVSNFDNAIRTVVQDVYDGRRDGGFTSFGSLTKSGNYTVLAADAGKIIDCTATLTLTLPAAASSTGFTFLVKATGANITIDANASELIDGALTKIVYNGFWAMLTCTGTAWLFALVQSGSRTNENSLINGNFDIWQRNTTQSATGMLSDDRWDNSSSGSTIVSGRQAHTTGQTDVPGSPTYFSRTTITSVAGVGNYVQKTQKIENVRTHAGETVTLTLWARHGATASSMSVELLQYFGTGGSPSANVSGIGVTKFALTSTFAKYSTVISVPSISGKTIGSNENSYVNVILWFDAGSNFNARTSSLGQLSWVPDISRVSLVRGDVSHLPDPWTPPSVGDELQKCMRYYEKTFNSGVVPAQDVKIGKGDIILPVNTSALTATNMVVEWRFRVPKRAAPTITTYNPDAANANWRNSALGADYTANVDNISETSATMRASNVAAGLWAIIHATADAEL